MENSVDPDETASHVNEFSSFWHINTVQVNLGYQNTYSN